MFVGNDGDPPEQVDFIVYDRNPNPNANNIQRLNSTNLHASLMRYLLFFLYRIQVLATHVSHMGLRTLLAMYMLSRESIRSTIWPFVITEITSQTPRLVQLFAKDTFYYNMPATSTSKQKPIV